mmetsp:Transcript_11778/g.31429  ORF Transcript_11778/g.31429 Transcript_11778/m.31429 type:complete len:124 (+) Transcript_11778:1039-1410(+)
MPSFSQHHWSFQPDQAVARSSKSAVQSNGPPKGVVEVVVVVEVEVVVLVVVTVVDVVVLSVLVVRVVVLEVDVDDVADVVEVVDEVVVSQHCIWSGGSQACAEGNMELGLMLRPLGHASLEQA